MSLPRMTTPRWLIAVAVVALGMGAVSWTATMRARSVAYRRRASELEWSALRDGKIVFLPDGRWYDRFENENHRRHDEWALRLAAKYQRLSYYPWLIADPDPPPPKPLPNPRSSRDLPGSIEPLRTSLYESRPPAWTFLWTRGWPNSLL